MASTTSSLSFITSNKGKFLLVLNDFVYRLKKETKFKKYWICQDNGCTAYIHTDTQNIFIKSSGDHNHLCESEALKIKQFRDNLKQRAVQETTAISKIYEEEVIKSELSTEVLANLPLVREIRKCICLFNIYFLRMYRIFRIRIVICPASIDTCVTFFFII